jgi:hypothetical protein
MITRKNFHSFPDFKNFLNTLKKYLPNNLYYVRFTLTYSDILIDYLDNSYRTVYIDLNKFRIGNDILVSKYIYNSVIGLTGDYISDELYNIEPYKAYLMAFKEENVIVY